MHQNQNLNGLWTRVEWCLQLPLGLESYMIHKFKLLTRRYHILQNIAFISRIIGRLTWNNKNSVKMGISRLWILNSSQNLDYFCWSQVLYHDISKLIKVLAFQNYWITDQNIRPIPRNTNAKAKNELKQILYQACRFVVPLDRISGYRA